MVEQTPALRAGLGGHAVDLLGRSVDVVERMGILPKVLAGRKVLVAAHGNSLRALIMVLDRLTPATIPGVELETGVPIVYRLRADSTVEAKAVLKP